MEIHKMANVSQGQSSDVKYLYGEVGMGQS